MLAYTDIASICLSPQNPKRNESQAMLSWCLEAASGFYLTLLQEICTAFDLDLPFRR
jgi:protein SMG7